MVQGYLPMVQGESLQRVYLQSHMILLLLEEAFPFHFCARADNWWPVAVVVLLCCAVL